MKRIAICILTLALLCSCSANSNEEKPVELEESINIDTQEVGEVLIEENLEITERISVFEAKCLSEKEALALINSKFLETSSLTYDYSMSNGRTELVGNEQAEKDSDEKHPLYTTWAKIDGRLFIITIVADQIFATEMLEDADGNYIGNGDILSENDYILIFDSKNSEFIKVMIPEGEPGYRQVEFIDEYSLKQPEKR